MPNGTDLDRCPRNVTSLVMAGKDISNRGRKCRKHWSPNGLDPNQNYRSPCCRLSCNPNDTEYQSNMSAGKKAFGQDLLDNAETPLASDPGRILSSPLIQFASQRVFVELWQDRRRPCYPQHFFCNLQRLKLYGQRRGCSKFYGRFKTTTSPHLRFPGSRPATPDMILPIDIT